MLWPRKHSNNIRWAQEQAQILNLDIADRISEISLSDEESFHKKKMENYLASAANAAREGNRSRYQNNIRWAQEQAQILNLDIADRISEISLSDEESFHKKKMENYLASAANAAREGNRSRYQNNIRWAQEEADFIGEDPHHHTSDNIEEERESLISSINNILRYGKTCSICLESLVDDDIDVKEMNFMKLLEMLSEIGKSNNPDCNHYFHYECIKSWFDQQDINSCPNCRLQANCR